MCAPRMWMQAGRVCMCVCEKLQKKRASIVKLFNGCLPLFMNPVSYLATHWWCERQCFAYVLMNAYKVTELLPYYGVHRYMLLQCATWHGCKQYDYYGIRAPFSILQRFRAISHSWYSSNLRSKIPKNLWNQRISFSLLK